MFPGYFDPKCSPVRKRKKLYANDFPTLEAIDIALARIRKGFGLYHKVRPVDMVVVWKLYRLSRFLKNLLTIMEHFDKAESGFRSLTESIDTTTPAGRMLMQMVGAFAEFEREMIHAGLHAARDQGRIGGWPSKLTNHQNQDFADNVLSGRKSGADMARLYNVSDTTVSR